MAGQVGAEARRLRKPGWKDPRLLVGILLVAGSVAGTVGLVSARDRTMPMYVAKEDISFGEPVDASRLDVVDVRLDGTREHYLPAGREPAAGTRANTLIRAGELVPLRGLGLDDGTTRKPVSIELEQTLPAAVVPGSRVDVCGRGPRPHRQRVRPARDPAALGRGRRGVRPRLRVRRNVRGRRGAPGRRRPDGGSARGGGQRGPGYRRPQSGGRRIVSVAVVVWGENGALVEGLERLRGAVTVVRRCAELTEVVALAETGLADAALLAGDPGLIDAPVLDALAGRGIQAVVLTGDPGEAARLGALGAAVESPGTDRRPCPT